MLVRFNAEDKSLPVVIVFLNASCKMGIICVLQLCIVMAHITVATSLPAGLGMQHKTVETFLSTSPCLTRDPALTLHAVPCIDHAASQEWQSSVQTLDLRPCYARLSGASTAVK